MSENVALNATPDEVAEYEVILDRYLADMEQIALNRRETKRLRIETDLILKDTLALLKVA